MQRRAACACGQLKALVDGDPLTVAVCSCTICQKRTGSAFGVSAFFETETQLISIEGYHKAFRRTSDSGRWVEHHFCPECGSTVFWYPNCALSLIRAISSVPLLFQPPISAIG